MARRTPSSIALALALVGACAPTPPRSDAPELLPDGWFLSGGGARQFRAAVDPAIAHGGRASARLEAVRRDVDSAATLMQSVAPEPYRGRRVRFSGFIATRAVTGWAGLWMRADRPDGASAFDNMQDRALDGTTVWTRCEVVLDVAPDASALHFGLVQDGAGASWLDDAALEIVSDAVASTELDLEPATQHEAETPRALGNADFEAGDRSLAPWFHDGEPGGAEVMLDRELKHTGRASARIQAQPGKIHEYGAVVQSVPASGYRGRRIRVTAAIKTADVLGDFWLRVQPRNPDPDGPGLSWVTHDLVGTADWRDYTFVVDVPPGGETLEIAAGVRGRGALWLDDVRLERVGRDVALAEGSPDRRTLLNGDFEAGSGDRTEGWFLSGEASGDFEAVLDRGERAGGVASARLRPRVRRPGGYGTLMTGFLAEDYRGKRLHMTAQVKGQGITGRGDLWLRVQAPSSPADGPGLGGGGCRLSGSFAWKPCDVVFDVPDEAWSIQLGIGLAAPGTIWLDQVRIDEIPRERLPTEAARRRAGPINLDFEAPGASSLLSEPGKHSSASNAIPLSE